MEMFVSIALLLALEWKSNLIILYCMFCGCLVTSDAPGLFPRN